MHGSKETRMYGRRDDWRCKGKEGMDASCSEGRMNRRTARETDE